MLTVYINKITGECIDDNSIVSVTDDGLILYENGCWKLLAKGQYTDSTDSSQENLTIPGVAGGTINTILSPEKITSKSMRYYTYYLGLNNISIANRGYSKVSAIVSDSFDVAAGTKLKLKASVVIPKYTSVEFSIIDGIKDTPILPQGITNIVDEKLFFQLPLRFTGTNYSYYKNFVYAGATKDALNMKNDSSLYTVSYTPDESAYTYMPEHSSVKVKTLFRVYKDDVQVPEVKKLFVYQK